MAQLVGTVFFDDRGACWKVEERLEGRDGSRFILRASHDVDRQELEKLLAAGDVMIDGLGRRARS